MLLKENSVLNNSAVSQFIQSKFDPFANRAHSSSGSSCADKFYQSFPN